jgi:hypothetical protein
VALIALSLKRCKTRTVSTKNCVNETVCTANKHERHILCLRCTERLWNAAVNEHVNSHHERETLVPQIYGEDMWFEGHKAFVRLSPSIHPILTATSVTLSKHKVLGMRYRLFWVILLLQSKIKIRFQPDIPSMGINHTTTGLDVAMCYWERLRIPEIRISNLDLETNPIKKLWFLSRAPGKYRNAGLMTSWPQHTAFITGNHSAISQAAI